MRLSDIIAGSVLRVQETLTLLIHLTITLTATRIFTVFCSFSLLLFVHFQAFLVILILILVGVVIRSLSNRLVHLVIHKYWVFRFLLFIIQK